MKALLIISSFFLAASAGASGRSWECWDDAGNLMMSWESGLGSLRPFAGHAAVTPIGYAGYDEILSGAVKLVASSKPGEPARYVLEGTIGTDDYRAIIGATRTGVLADIANLTKGRSLLVGCQTGF